MILAHGGARSKHLAELHKKYSVIRTGPNTLSYGELLAIKDIYGHNTKCVKDALYVVTSGTHFHLADVVDKRKLFAPLYLMDSLSSLMNSWLQTLGRALRSIVPAPCCSLMLFLSNAY